jgi:hypothetical protein
LYKACQTYHNVWILDIRFCRLVLHCNNSLRMLYPDDAAC